MLITGLLILATGYGTLNWCAVTLGRANPEHRLPGKLPAVVQPPSYMLLGMVGITLVILGAVLARGRADFAAWAIAAGVMLAALVAPFMTHNHRLPR